MISAILFIDSKGHHPHPPTHTHKHTPQCTHTYTQLKHIQRTPTHNAHMHANAPLPVSHSLPPGVCRGDSHFALLPRRCEPVRRSSLVASYLLRKTTLGLLPTTTCARVRSAPSSFRKQIIAAKKTNAPVVIVDNCSFM